MPKPKLKPTAQDILEVLNGMWVSKKGITTIAFCGDNKAAEDMKKIRKLVKDKYGKECPRDYVPTEEVIEFYNINVNYLRRVSK